MAEFEAALENVLRREIDAFETLISAERLTGGASQETYRLVARIDGVEQTLAFRRSAGGATEVVEGRPGLAAEAELMRVAAAAGVPEPEVLAVIDPQRHPVDTGLGLGFVMEWLEGETLGARIVRAPELDDVRSRLAYQIGRILARIHQIDVAATGLDALLTTKSTEDYVNETWQRYQDLGTPQPMIDYTARWLLDNLPPAVTPRLVHNDFRNGNIMVDHTGVVAVLDWETAHIGDPMRDLGWICTNSWRFGRSDLPVGGFGHYNDLFAGYEDESGIRVDAEHVKYWEVFGSFWWAAGTLGMGEHWRNGPDPSVERPAIARRSSECQIDCVNLLIPGPTSLVPADTPPRDGSSSDLPTNDELVASVIAFLREDVMAHTEGRTQFLARVAANSLDIVRREFASSPAHRAAETKRLLDLGMGKGTNPADELGSDQHDGDALLALRWELTRSLRDGSLPLDRPGLAEHLRLAVTNQVAIDQPKYSGLATALAFGRGLES